MHYADSKITVFFENSMNKGQTFDDKGKSLPADSDGQPKIVAKVEMLKGNRSNA